MMGTRLFQRLGETEAQNIFLKGVLAFVSLVVVALLASITVLALRRSDAYLVSGAGTSLLIREEPAPDLRSLEVRRGIERFLNARFTWTPDDIEASLKSEIEMTSPEARSIRTKAVTEEVKVAKERGLSERIYIRELAIDLGSATVTVAADRLIAVKDVRAVTPLDLSIKYAFGERTARNPEGVYVSSAGPAQHQDSQGKRSKAE